MEESELQRIARMCRLDHRTTYNLGVGAAEQPHPALQAARGAGAPSTMGVPLRELQGESTDWAGNTVRVSRRRGAPEELKKGGISTENGFMLPAGGNCIEGIGIARRGVGDASSARRSHNPISWQTFDDPERAQDTSRWRTNQQLMEEAVRERLGKNDGLGPNHMSGDEVTSRTADLMASANQAVGRAVPKPRGKGMPVPMRPNAYGNPFVRDERPYAHFDDTQTRLPAGNTLISKIDPRDIAATMRREAGEKRFSKQTDPRRKPNEPRNAADKALVTSNYHGSLLHQSNCTKRPSFGR